MSDTCREEHPAACSTQLTLEFGAPMQAAEIRKRLDALLSDLTGFLKDNGCWLVGHIKGLFDAGDSGQLFFSIISFTDGIQYKGELVSEVAEAKLSMNVIVYGVEEESIENKVQRLIKEQF